MVSGYQEPVGGTSSPSTGTAIGSKPIRAILRMFKGIDISLEAAYGTDFIPTLDSPFQITANKIRLANPAQTFYTSFESPAITANQFVKLPTITTTESSIRKDEVVLLKQTQEVKNKNIDINPASTDENIIYDDDADTTHMATFDINGKLVKSLISSLPVVPPADNSITDAKIAAHTSTKITITTKAQLPSDTVYATGVQTISDKTFITPTIATIINNGATLTLPATAQIILGRTTIDPLTNKTLDSITSTLKNVGAYKYQIFKDGSTYYCRNNQTGAIEVSNASPDTVLAYPITNGGSCYVHGPVDYILTGNPAVFFDFPKDPVLCEFYMAADAWVVVPNGYTGTVFRLQNSDTLHCTGHKLGVNIKEAGIVALNWTGILIEAIGGTNSRGIYDCHIQYAKIIKPGIGIKFNNATGSTKGFITTNYVDNVMMWTPKTAAVDFVMDEPYSTTPPNINGIHRNRFRNMLVQGNGSDTTVGVRNIRHKDNSFYGCYIADFVGNSKTATIHADATSTIIDGGSMDVIGRFEDNSTSQTTKIRSEYRQTQFGRVTPGINGVQIDIVPTGATNDWSWWNSDSSERLQLRKTATDYQFNFTKQTAGGSLRPALFKQVDVQGTTVESFRIETDAGLRVNSNKLRLRDSNDSHNISIIVPDVAADVNLAIPATMTASDSLVLVNSANATNSSIAAHTSTKITITAKAQLNSQIAYKDENNWLTEAMTTKPSLFCLIKEPTWGKKKGGFQGTSTATGWGIMGGLTGIGNFVALDIDSTYGSYVPRATGNVAGNNAGFSYANALTMRKFNPILAVLVRTTHVSLNRMYIGWKSTATSPTALTDDPLSGLSGVMFLQRSGDTTWRIISNDGTVSTIVDTGATISSTIPSNLQIKAVDSLSKWQYSIDGGANWVDVTGTFPAQTTKLFYVGESQTNEAVIHNLHTFLIEVASDK